MDLPAESRYSREEDAVRLIRTAIKGPVILQQSGVAQNSTEDVVEADAWGSCVMGLMGIWRDNS